MAEKILYTCDACGKQMDDKHDISFVKNHIIKFELREYEDSSYLETFHFIEANEYIKKLQDKIDIVKEAIK